MQSCDMTVNELLPQLVSGLSPHANLRVSLWQTVVRHMKTTLFTFSTNSSASHIAGNTLFLYSKHTDAQCDSLDMPVQITTSSNAPEQPLRGMHCLCQSLPSLPTMQPYMWSYYLMKSLRDIIFNCSSTLNTDDLSINQCDMNQRKDLRAHRVQKQASFREEEAARAPTLRHAPSKYRVRYL